MIAFVAGICIKTGGRICPPDSTQIDSVWIASGGFLVIAVIGFLWLGYRSKR